MKLSLLALDLPRWDNLSGQWEMFDLLRTSAC
jgi:hypothetical protein